MKRKLTPEIRGHLEQFCMGWLMEFGDRPVGRAEWSTNAWYALARRQHLQAIGVDAYLATLDAHPLLSPVIGGGGWKLNERGWALIRGAESSTVADKLEEDA